MSKKLIILLTTSFLFLSLGLNAMAYGSTIIDEPIETVNPAFFEDEPLVITTTEPLITIQSIGACTVKAGVNLRKAAGYSSSAIAYIYPGNPISIHESEQTEINGLLWQGVGISRWNPNYGRWEWTGVKGWIPAKYIDWVREPDMY